MKSTHLYRLFYNQNTISKLEMIDQADTIAVEAPTIGQWLKEQDHRHAQQPIQRKYHSAIIHKLSLYIYGGIPQRPIKDHFAEQCTIYRYNITSKIWTKIFTHFLNNNSFSYIYAHSTIIYNNMMYLFGGRNYNTDAYLVGLWCLNLQSYNWKRQELKGYSPLPREHASMVLHQKSSIFLYGGRNGEQNLNDIHIYRIQNKLWIQVQQSSYDFKLPCRLKPAICSLGQHIYLFGGERMQNVNGITTNSLQKDFYQLRLINKPMSNKPDIWIKQIITNYGPTEKIASFVTIGEKYLLLRGPENKMGGQSLNSPGIWVYSANEINWTWLNFKKNVKELPSLGSTLNYSNDRCFFFGEYKSNISQSEMVEQNVVELQNDNSGLLICQLQLKELENKLPLPQLKHKMIENNDIECHQCIDNNNSLRKHKLNKFEIMTQELHDILPFVYSAFGLLVDNAQIGGAKEVRIIFHHTFKEKYCLIEDNGVNHKLWSSNTEFINDFTTLRTYVEENIDTLEQEKEQQPKKPSSTEINQQMQGLLNKQTKQQREQREKEAKDKQMQKQLKKRKRIAKQNFRRKKEQRIEYSRNVKLGALRIGDKLIFISRYGPNNDNRRVFVLEKQNNAGKDAYNIYFYIVESGSLIDSSMDSAKKYIDEEYKSFIKISNDHKEQANNFVFITKLFEIVNEKGQLEPELKESTRHNDVFCCEKKMIQSIDECLLTDSIDVSLKNYLALLYLKSDQLKISLSISQHRNIDINNSQIFDRIDTLVKSDRLIDLMAALDLSNCNIIEVYYNKSNTARARDMNRKAANQNFLNGVVFYHKNRLISRYKFNLGETPKLFKNKLKSMQHNLLMFGFIEIKQDFAVNIFKTGFVRDDLLEQIYHRLKFVQKYAEKYGKEVKEQSKKNIEQKMEPPKKRFKPNDEAKQEVPNNSQVIEIDE